MRSFRFNQNYPLALPFLHGEFVEYHAARLLLLVRYCGKLNCIKGLTKLAKLDFFVRYPSAFYKVCAHLGKEVSQLYSIPGERMVRYHYGPWDRRYYHILSYLESKALLEVTVDTSYEFKLTRLGVKAAANLNTDADYLELIEFMKLVKKHFGNRKGSSLKKLIYEVLDAEVGKLQLNTEIK